MINSDAMLTIQVNSFSYKTTGIPIDDTENGGGYVFDCRGILNPGRIQEYKLLTGRDQSVMEYLETQTQMKPWLNAIHTILKITIEDYIDRGFSHLQINFGCTGGQHRSVYATDATAQWIQSTFPQTQVDVFHRVQDAKNWTNL